VDTHLMRGSFEVTFVLLPIPLASALEMFAREVMPAFA